MKNDRKHKDRCRRKEKYDLLRDAGYTSTEANRYKDMSDGKIDSLIALKREETRIRTRIINGGDYEPNKSGTI